MVNKREREQNSGAGAGAREVVHYNNPIENDTE